MLSIEQYFEFKYKIFELQKEGIDPGCLYDISYCVGLDFEDWDEDAEQGFMKQIYNMVQSEEEFVEEMVFRYDQTCEAEKKKRERYRQLVCNRVGQDK